MARLILFDYAIFNLISSLFSKSSSDMLSARTAKIMLSKKKEQRATMLQLMKMPIIGLFTSIILYMVIDQPSSDTI